MYKQLERERLLAPGRGVAVAHLCDCGRDLFRQAPPILGYRSVPLGL
jgi:hypothetical protein